jgi:hypothetical protein
MTPCRIQQSFGTMNDDSAKIAILSYRFAEAGVGMHSVMFVPSNDEPVPHYSIVN